MYVKIPFMYKEKRYTYIKLESVWEGTCGEEGGAWD